MVADIKFLFYKEIKQNIQKWKIFIFLRIVAAIFLTFLLILTTTASILVILNNILDKIYTGTSTKTAEHTYILIIYSIVVPIIWTTNLLKLIFLSKIIKNFKKNFFKSLLAFKNLLKIKFLNPKKCVQYNLLKEFIIEKMFEQKLALQGSASILHKYNFFIVNLMIWILCQLMLQIKKSILNLKNLN